MQGKVYDVTGKAAYQPGGSYHGESLFTELHEARELYIIFVVCIRVKARCISPSLPISVSLPIGFLRLTPGKVFSGKDASRALGKTSTKPEDVKAEWQDLDEKEKSTLNDWITYFSKRYNVVGVIEGATNMD